MVKRVKRLMLARFTPQETEQITGVSQATQRDWRRRELTSFEMRKGWKRFTSYDLAHLVVMAQLLPHVRPAVAYRLARMSCDSAVIVLARRRYPKWDIEIEGERVNLNDLTRYAVYCRHMHGSSIQLFVTSKLNTPPKQVKQGGVSLPPIAFYLVVDSHQIADELQSRQIKPYFIDMENS